MHVLGDEQWCGVTHDKTRAGYKGSTDGYFYYSGRRSSRQGALHAPRQRTFQGSFESVSSGDTIGIVIDMHVGVIAFLLNGVVQGACGILRQPLYLTTSPDTANDYIELRKPPLADVPPAAMEALKGVLLWEYDAEDILSELAQFTPVQECT